MPPPSPHLAEVIATEPHPGQPKAQHSACLRKAIPSSHHREHQCRSANRFRRISPTVQRHERSGETSTAEQWFDKLNLNVSKHHGSFRDNDSPFYLPNKDDSEDSPPPHVNGFYQQFPMRTLLSPLPSQGSSSGEYRSVIDDLTVENQRLKRQLKRFESMHDANLDGEKLFEVKVHGLSPGKKRELEDMLRTFAADIHHSPRSGDAAVSSVGAQPVNLLPAEGKSDASTRSSAKWADSGYGSMGSGAAYNVLPTVGAPKNRSTQTSSFRQTEPTKANGQNVRTYLDDVPHGLFPRHAIEMTEKSKKKLVVRRLEQLFGGRGAAPGGHQQSEQQQEVSRAAAQEDRTALAAIGRTPHSEGVREAKIMDHDSEAPIGKVLGTTNSASSLLAVAESSDVNNSSESIPLKSRSPEQRPTRPLDLDPDRAQVPAENINYIKHLGFLRRTEDQQPVPVAEGGEWIYFNLLISMAQLHTMNVTPDFVKKAIADYSTKFELSEDGRKVRWKAAGSGPDNASDIDIPTTPVDEDGSSRKRPLPADPYAPLVHAPKRQATSVTGQAEKWSYQPLFHLTRNDGASSFINSGHSRTSSMPGNSSGYTSGSLHPTSSNARSHESGPIIFYTKAAFCTDLSGDVQLPSGKSKIIDYIPCTAQILGKPSSATLVRDPTRSSNLQAMSRPPVVDESESVPLDLDFPSTRSSPKHVVFLEPESIIRLDASGIGGVTPFDNFAITVLRQRTPFSGESIPQRSITTSLSKLSPVFAAHRTNNVTNNGVRERIFSARVTALDPSPLPPAIMDFISSSDCNSDSSDSDSESGFLLEDSAESPGHSPALPIQHRNQASLSIGSRILRNERNGDAHKDMEDDAAERESISSTAAQPLSEVDSSSPPAAVSTFKKPRAPASEASGSVDFLAQARLMQPNSIRAQERMYDAEMAEKLAEEIPAGSSAATAGGGSGFGSPAGRVGRQLLVRAGEDVDEEDDEDGQVSDESRSDISLVSDVPS